MPDSFHRFPDLPPELRLQIWQHIVREPRTIRIGKLWFGRYTSSTPPPACLAVNSESRAVAKRHYATHFWDPNRVKGLDASDPWYASVLGLECDLAIDTVMLGSRDLFGMWYQQMPEMKCIRYMTLEARSGHFTGDGKGLYYQDNYNFVVVLMRFPELREVEIRLEAGCPVQNRVVSMLQRAEITKPHWTKPKVSVYHEELGLVYCRNGLDAR